MTLETTDRLFESKAIALHAEQEGEMHLQECICSPIRDGSLSAQEVLSERAAKDDGQVAPAPVFVP
jgi:hypothetical protein